MEEVVRSRHSHPAAVVGDYCSHKAHSVGEDVAGSRSSAAEEVCHSCRSHHSVEDMAGENMIAEEDRSCRAVLRRSRLVLGSRKTSELAFFSSVSWSFRRGMD